MTCDGVGKSEKLSTLIELEKRICDRCRLEAMREVYG